MGRIIAHDMNIAQWHKREFLMTARIGRISSPDRRISSQGLVVRGRPLHQRLRSASSQIADGLFKNERPVSLVDMNARHVCDNLALAFQQPRL